MLYFFVKVDIYQVDSVESTRPGYLKSIPGRLRGVNDRLGYIKALWYWVVKTTPFIYTASHIKCKVVLGKCSTNVGFRMPYIYLSNSLNICLGSHARRLSTILQFR